MANLTLAQIFGSRVSTDINPSQNKYLVTLDLRDFQNISDGGEISDNRGISNLEAQSTEYQNNGVLLLYAILLLTLQNQAENIFSDPSQKIFISQGRKAFATGPRDGQIIQNMAINLFSDSNVPTLPDIDDLGSSDTTNNEGL